MDEDVAKTVINALRDYLNDELPLDKDFIRKLDRRDLLASDKAPMLVALADKGDKGCIHGLVTYMEQFYTEDMLLSLCKFLEEYAQQVRPKLYVISSTIRREISKHKPQIPLSVPEADTLYDDVEVLYPVITPLKQKFSDLVAKVFVVIGKLKRERMEELHSYLTTLLTDVRQSRLPIVPKPVDELKEFLRVKWDELNIQVLESIVDHLKDDKLTKMMTNYQQTLSREGRNPLSECPVKTGQLDVAPKETLILAKTNVKTGQLDVAPKETLILAKTDRSPDQLTLEDVFSLRNLINSLGRGIRAIFRGFKRGCTILYFSIPTECAWSLPSCLLPSNLSLLEEWKVLFFSVKGAFTVDIKERRLVDSLDKHSLLSSLSEYKTRNDDLQTRNDDLQTRNDDLQTRNDDLQTRVQQMEKGLSFKEKELRVMEKEVKPYVVVSETQRQPQPGDDKMSVLGLSRVKRSPPTWDKNPPSKRPKSNIDLASRPSEVDLRNISYITGKNWKDLLRSLKIAEPKIDELVSNNPNDIAEAYFQGLMFWKNENALLPVTWSTLVEALKKAKLTKLANELPPKENKPKVTPPVREDTLHRSAGVHDEPLEMDTEGGNGNAPSRPPGAGTERGHQTAKADAPIAKNPKHTDFKDVTVVESISELWPYHMDMLPHLYELGAALGLFESSKAIIDGHGTPEEKCLHILSHWLKSTPRPTWACLCQKLRRVSCFNAVVHKIARDHNLPTADMDGRELSGISSGEVPITSNLDFLPFLDYFIPNLLLLSVVLGIESQAADILKYSTNATDKCLDILGMWLSTTAKPTWKLFCSLLKRVAAFNNVRSRIEEARYRQDLLLPDDSSPPPPPTPPPPTWTKQYEKAIQQRGSVTLHITRCVLIGPPRVGKSSLKLLLINNEPPDKEVEKSTDLMEAPVVLTSIQYQDKKGSQWKELTPNNLQQLVSKCTRDEGYDPAQLNPIQSSHTSLSTAVVSDTDNVSTTVADSLNTSTHLVDELEVRYHDFVHTKMSEASLAELKLNGLKMVHVFDCGGQLAFQDTIPLLINAPCAFISVFNASVDLDEEVELKYCPEKGVELGMGYKESQWNMLRRIFSSIHFLQFKCHEDIMYLIKKEENNTTAREKDGSTERKGTKVVLSSPIAVVGTHKDVLREASKKDGGLRQRRTEEKIKEYLARLRDSKLYDFLREGCTHDLVTNQFKDDLSAIESLRNDITESKATLSLELPLPWIILELFTRDLKQNFFPFLDLQQLCIRKNIVSHKEEFSSLLKVLHVLGFYAFYQLDGVPEDQNWVCTDAATLYREVTKMLVVQYKKNIKKGATIELQQYGRIKLNKATLQDLFTDLEISIGGADPMWLIRVLLHIGLAVKIVDEEQGEAFIPLALPFKRSDLPPITSVATICFTLEFPSVARKSLVVPNVTEIPRGIFPRLIVYLLSQQCSGDSGCEWKVGKGDSRSQIKLMHHSQGYFIYLSEHIDRIELDLVLNVTFLPATQHKVTRTTKVGNLCQVLREHLISALRKTFVLVFGDQPAPNRKPTVVCGFKCSTCHDSFHMAVVRPAAADESTPQHPPYTEKCVHEPHLQYVEMADQLIWFSPVIETTFEKETTHDQNGQWTIWVMKGSDASKLGDKPSSIELLDAVIPKVAADWEVLSIRLELEDKGRIIAKDYAKVEDRCRHIFRAWTNGEGRKPVTWETLLEVMGKCGYKDLTDELAERLKRGETLDK